MTLENLQLPLFWLLLCAIAGGLVLSYYSLRRPNVRSFEQLVAIIAMALASLSLIIRGLLIHGLPMANGMDFSLWLIVLILGMYLVLAKKKGLEVTGLLVYPMLLALAIWLVNNDLQVSAMQPALRSVWLVFHVSTAIIAYASFAMSFILSVLYLVSGRSGLGHMDLPAPEVLDRGAYTLSLIGLPFLTIMLVTGAVWAEYAWGRFWSWDPKETWALITWLIYAVYLHVRLRNVSGGTASILNVVGFLAVLFTFFGVSYLLPGLHSYL